MKRSRLSESPPAHTPSKRWAVFGWRVFAIGIRLCVLCGVAVVAWSPKLVDRDWRFDLVASLLAQFVLVAAAFALWQAVWRRWIWCVLFVLAGSGCLGWMMVVERSPRALAGGVDAAHLTVLQINMYSRNPDADGIFELIARYEPDVVVILETSPAMRRALAEGRAPIRYTHHAGLDRASPGQIVVLSSFPLKQHIDGTGPLGLHRSWGYWAGYMMVAERPVRFAAVHAPSPRSETTWGYGKDTFRRIGALFERLGTPLGTGDMPTMLVGDLNAAPTSTRSLMITDDFGLVRAKPLRVWDGTYPSMLPWFARASIDDSMLSPDIAVRSWRTVRVPGSDHRGVLLELSISVGAMD